MERDLPRSEIETAKRKTPRLPFPAAVILAGIFCLFGAAAGADDQRTELPPENGDADKCIIGRYKDGDGNEIVKVVIPGSPPPTQRMPAAEPPPPGRGRGTNSLSEAPAFNWTYGCAATSAGMLCGYYDRGSFPNLYAGGINGGVCPLDNSGWGGVTVGEGGDGECSFIASHNGLDGRTTRGHVDDYWMSYGSNGDPYYNSETGQNNWEPHNRTGSGDCLADFMGTNQYYPANLHNSDGSSVYSCYSSGGVYIPSEFGDLTNGVRRYAEHCGYTMSRYYNQLIYGFWDNTKGFTFAQFKEEIDAGRPVLIHVVGHTMLGIGYDDAEQKIYLHDTWDYETHEMIWGGSYSGMAHMAVSVFEFSTEPPTDDAYEPNNIQATAYDFSANENTWLSTIGGSGVQADDDWYKISITSGRERVKIECTFTDSQGNIDISLHNAAGERLASSTSITDNENIDYTTPAGIYYIRVYQGDAGNNYDLWWNTLQAEKYSGGIGTESDPYQIATKADLLELGDTPDDYGRCFVMTADIDLAGETFTTAVIAPDTDNAAYGFQGTKFTGTFAGGGHAIQNLVIDASGTENDYLGLFGYVDDSSSAVLHLRTEGGTITGGNDSDYLGGICANNAHGIISDCHNTGSVTGGDGSDYLGGICGKKTYDTITNCSATGNLTGGSSARYLGGICGNNTFGTITNCCTTGNLSGSSTLGGICGDNTFGTITNCYATGSLAGSSSLGGICGENDGTISRCYATGSVAGDTYCGGICGTNEHGTVTDCYFYLWSALNNHCGLPLSLVELQNSSSYSGFDFANNNEDGTAEIWSISPGYLPRLSWETGDGPLPPAYGAPPTTLEGNGTKVDPFTLTTAADIEEFRNNTALDRGYYRLAQDIDLATSPAFPTALVDRRFGGFFSGGGFVVKNLVIDTAGANTGYLGFFRYVVGDVSELGIVDFVITGGNTSSYLGGLCGYNNGNIGNCYANGSVTGDNYLGGLCGYSNGNISCCYANASVAGDNNLGGLCGGNNHGTISNCHAAGDVAGDDYLGGLCGNNNYGSITNCYATGILVGDYELGGLCGSDYNGTITNCFWDTESSGIATSDGGTGLATAEMQTQSTFTNAGWDFAGETTNGTDDFWRMDDYPVLTCFDIVYTLSLDIGWNLVSLPFEPLEPDVDAVFAEANIVATRNEAPRDDGRGLLKPGGIWGWNPQTLSYFEVTTIEACRGYWVFVSEETGAIDLEIAGTPATEINHLEKGWNLLGVISDLEIANDEISPFIWNWDGTYHLVEGTLTEGWGYWLHTQKHDGTWLRDDPSPE